MAHTTMDRNTAIAFVTGTLLGAGVALLVAPQTGRKARRDIRQFAEKAGNKAEAAQLELRHSIENIIGDVSEKLQEGLACRMDWTDSKIADLQGALEEARKSITGELRKSSRPRILFFNGNISRDGSRMINLLIWTYVSGENSMS